MNKPQGWTSFDVVARIRKLSGTRRVGHGGTLDPAATGVLPVGVGRATRFLEYLLLGRKEYEATIILGKSTDTYDAEGTVNRTGDPSMISLNDVEAAIPQFIGEIQQVPPAYSALKLRGAPLYQYARAGIEVSREPRAVTVDNIDITGFQSPNLHLTVECGRGTYIRSIAHDLGEALGCGAHLGSLKRTRVGPFRLRDAVDLDSLPALADGTAWYDYLYAPETPLEEESAAIITADSALALRQGKAIQLPTDNDSSRTDSGRISRAYDVYGQFVGVICFDSGAGTWRPQKVHQAEIGANYV